MDVAAIAGYTGAMVYGSAHTCRIVEACGLPAAVPHAEHRRADDHAIRVLGIALVSCLCVFALGSAAPVAEVITPRCAGNGGSALRCRRHHAKPWTIPYTSASPSSVTVSQTSTAMRVATMFRLCRHMRGASTRHEQVAFLQKLYRNALPFRVEHQRLVKDVMIVEAGRTWILRAKTGWAARAKPQVGWWVGWVEWPEGPVFFAINIDMPNGADDLTKRERIARDVLRSIGALPVG